MRDPWVGGKVGTYQGPGGVETLGRLFYSSRNNLELHEDDSSAGEFAVDVFFLSYYFFGLIMNETFIRIMLLKTGGHEAILVILL